MNVRIAGIASYLPAHAVSNSDLAREYPDWDVEQSWKRTGVSTRYIANDSETALDLAVEACRRLFDEQKLDPTTLDALVFCTQSHDFIMPGNGFLLHDRLGLGDNVFVLDLNLACSGFVYGLELARGFIATGAVRRMLLVTAETYSKYMGPADRSVRLLFGDGAAATLCEATSDERGVMDCVLSSRGSDFSAFYVPAGGCRFPEATSSTPAKIHMDGMRIWSFVQSAVPKQIHELLGRNELDPRDIDLWVFHQGSRLTLDGLARVLALDASKVYSNLQDVGNTVSASIPIALAQAEREGRLRPGMKIVLSGFGAGLSWGSALLYT